MPDGGRVLLTTDVDRGAAAQAGARSWPPRWRRSGTRSRSPTADYQLHLRQSGIHRPHRLHRRGSARAEPRRSLLRSTEHDPAFFAEIDRRTRGGRSGRAGSSAGTRTADLIHQDATISPIHDETGRLDPLRRGQARRLRQDPRRSGAARQRGALPRTPPRACPTAWSSSMRTTGSSSTTAAIPRCCRQPCARS